MEKAVWTLLSDSDILSTVCKTDFEEATEYRPFTRCLSDQTVVENEKRRPKNYKKVAFFITSKNESNRAKCQRYMQSEDFSSLAELRNGVETIPSNIWKNYHYRLDKLPRGKQRGRFFFGSKMAALNFRKLFGFRKGLGNYAQNPVLA